MIDESRVTDFQQTVWDYYHDHGRHDLPWRQTVDPYAILVSEIMLQQTQVSRVISKYQQFLGQFPAVERLAAAPMADVLRVWSGLGYNRRAKFLHQAAQSVIASFGGQFPDSLAELVKLPGVGPNTAGAILAYAHNQPVVFVETNIRTVYLHHFFSDKTDIPDVEIRQLLEATIDQEQPREWYWALMDYGAHLKQTIGNQNHRSRSYAKQSKFEGSRRQIRGQVLRLLGEQSQTKTILAKHITDPRLDEVVAALLNEGLIHRRGKQLSL